VQTRDDLDRRGRAGRRSATDGSAHAVTSVAGRPRLVASAGDAHQGPVKPEPRPVSAILAAARSALSDREPSLAEVMSAVRVALEARDLFILCARAEVCGAGIEVTAFPVRQALRSLPSALAAEAAGWGPAGPDAASVRRIAMALGVGRNDWATGFVRAEDRDELLLATWDRGATPATEETMTVAAEVVAMTRAALRAHPANTTAYVKRERTELGQRLHDDVLQTITGAVLELEALRQSPGVPGDGLEAIDNAREALRRSVADIRRTVAALSEGRTPADPAAGMSDSLPGYIESVVEQWGLSTRVVIEGDLQRVPPIAVMLAGAVIREALVNVAKHAESGDVAVRVVVSDADLLVSVADRGPGFTPLERKRAATEHHLGLDILQRRIREYGGTLQIETSPGKGTRIVARLPIDEVAS
jgi:signal transduction histidine kinase